MASPVVLELDANVIDVACGSKHSVVLLGSFNIEKYKWFNKFVYYPLIL